MNTTWCKSFDLCKKPNSQSYCHLKDADWNDYDKSIGKTYLKSKTQSSDYYQCLMAQEDGFNRQPVNKDDIVKFIGEAREVNGKEVRQVLSKCSYIDDDTNLKCEQ